MIQISQKELKKAGGLLSALSIKSAEYLRAVLGPKNIKDFGGKEKFLERTIVHADPHLDEYFAELLFRACLPDTINIEFMEQTLFSEKNDLVSQHLWPNAAVFGIGRIASGGANALFLFDEHVAGKGKTAPSSSEVINDTFVRTMPQSIRQVLREINAIDEYGNAHPHHLNNLIKVLHEVRFLFQKGPSIEEDKRDYLPPFWKRALVNAIITAIIYCLENGHDLIENPDIKKRFIQESLRRYTEKTLHQNHANFDQALHVISSNYGNVSGEFQEAILRDSKGAIKDQSGSNIPQLFIFSRICFACHYCWGEDVTQAIMSHFWEVEFQRHLNFFTVQQELEKAFQNNGRHFVSAVGTFRREILPKIYVENMEYEERKRKLFKGYTPLWLIGFSPTSGIHRPNQPLLNYINKHNHGCGILFLENTFIGTKALFKGSSLPQDKWTDLVRLIQSKESSPINGEPIWYDASNDPTKAANFIINGNKAYQYVPRSGLDIEVLGELVRETFY